MKKKLNNRFTAAEKINLNNYITVNFQQINKMEPSVSWSDLAANIKKLIKITVTAPYLATIFNARAKTVRTLLVKRPILNSTKSLSKLDTNTSLVTPTKETKELKAAPYGLLTTQETATFFRVSARHIRNLTKSGDLPCIGLGICVRYMMDDLVRYIDRLRLESINRNLVKKGTAVAKPKTNKPMTSKGKMVDAQDTGNKIYANSDNQSKPNSDSELNSDLVYLESGGVVGFRRD